MRNLLILLCFLITVGAKAQTEVYDTAKRLDPFSTNQHDLHRNFQFKKATDSGMLYFSQYSRVRRTHTAIQDLGDVATPYLNLSYTPATQTGFITGFNPYGDYYFYNKNAKFYQAKLPYTYFYYTQGKAGQSGRGLIGFDAVHTQNIGERFNFSVNYHSTTNEAYFVRNTNVMKNIQTTAYYRTKNQRYLASTIMTWNKTGFNESGGLLQTKENELYFKNLPSNLRFAYVELVSARNVNRFRDHQFNHTFWIKGKYSDDTLKTFIPQLGIGHSFNWQKQGNYYTDQLADINSNIYDSASNYNQLYTADSMGFTSIGNSFEIFSPIREKGVSFTAGTRIDRLQYYQGSSATNYHLLKNYNHSIYGQVNFNFLKTFQSEVKGQLFLAGYNQTDHFLHWKNKAAIGKNEQYTVLLEAMSMAAQPTYQQSYMFSNHYYWNNQFKQQGHQTLRVGLSKKNKKPGVYNAYYYAMPTESFNVQFTYSLLSNYIYYGYDGKPAQINTAENVAQLSVHKHFNLKKFQVHQELLYQTFSSGLKSKIRLPDLLSKTSLYYQSYAFKKATFLQIGMDVNYTTEYNAKFYNPATRNFQLMDKVIGNYPYVDLFVNAEIKTAKIFFKMEHFNQDIGGRSLFPNYFYASPYQPTALRRFRLGVAWKFYY